MGYPQREPAAFVARGEAGPLTYGYIRITEDRDDEEIRQLEGELRKLAEAEGFCRIEICHEDQPGHGTLYRLIEELKQARIDPLQARICHVVVPTLDHLSAHPLLREQLVRRLDEVGVQVWVVEANAQAWESSGERM